MPSCLPEPPMSLPARWGFSRLGVYKMNSKQIEAYSVFINHGKKKRIAVTDLIEVIGMSIFVGWLLGILTVITLFEKA